jgi:hypothetical protein
MKWFFRVSSAKSEGKISKKPHILLIFGFECVAIKYERLIKDLYCISGL